MRKEQISAFMDGEATGREVEESIQALGQDSNLRGKWSRYHLIGEVLRTDRFVGEEETRRDPKIRRLERPSKTVLLSKSTVSLAMAASAAAIIFATVLFLGHVSEQQEYLLSETDPVEVSEEKKHLIAEYEPAGALGARYGDLREQEVGQTITQIGRSESAQEYENEHKHQLNGYFTNYNRQRARLGVPGVNPYVRMVGFDSE